MMITTIRGPPNVSTFYVSHKIAATPLPHPTSRLHGELKIENLSTVPRLFAPSLTIRRRRTPTIFRHPSHNMQVEAYSVRSLGVPQTQVLTGRGKTTNVALICTHTSVRYFSFPSDERESARRRDIRRAGHSVNLRKPRRCSYPRLMVPEPLLPLRVLSGGPSTVVLGLAEGSAADSACSVPEVERQGGKADTS